MNFLLLKIDSLVGAFFSSFKLFLELEPQLRDIIFKFYESKYASCLTLLDEMKDYLLLDMYIAPHVSKLYMQIRNRALIQYFRWVLMPQKLNHCDAYDLFNFQLFDFFSPYMSADMRKMAAAFNTTVPALEDELMQLILDGQIQARIDSHNKVIFFVFLKYFPFIEKVILRLYFSDFVRKRCRSA